MFTIAITILFLLTTLVICNNVVVHSPSGPIKGLKSLVPDTHHVVYKFFQIPYAKPPVGYLRFRKPEPIDPWTETLDGTNQIPKLCQQVFDPFLKKYYVDGIMVSEDCLFLDIFVPRTLSPHRKYPVMVWVHGGGFTLGSGSDGSDIAVRGGVIVVSIQYRLNIFGFLSLNNKYMRGNYGLWDQKMALTWINKDIASFGGDPNSVTLFGESAGGMSVHFQSLIPSNKGLFHRVIAQSGSSSFMTIGEESPRELIDDVVEKTNCARTEGFEEVFVDCLRKVPEEFFIQHFGHLMTSRAALALFLTYRPVIDGELFKGMPHELLKDPDSDVSKFHQSLDFMAGITSYETSFLYFNMPPELQQKFQFNVSEGIPQRLLCDGIAVDISDTFFDGSPQISKAICEHYSSTDPDSDVRSMRAIESLADAFFKVPAISAVEAHSNGNKKTYLYQLSRSAAIPFGPTPPKWYTGCGHANDVILLFKLDFSDEKVKEKDMAFSNTLISYWTKFANTGNPSCDETAVRWPLYTKDTKEYLDLNTECSVKHDMSPDAVKFWKTDIPNILKNIKEEL